MTTAQIIIYDVFYIVMLGVVAFFTRATPRRFAGAPAGGAADGVLFLGAVAFGEALGLWRLPMDWKSSDVPLQFFGLTVSGAAIALVS